MDCSKFVKYIKKNGRKIDILEGLEINKGYIYKFKGLNEFEKKETKIPDDYKKSELYLNLSNKCNPNLKLLEKNNDFYKKIKEKHKNDIIYFNTYITKNQTKYLIYVSKNKIYLYTKSDKHYIKKSDISKNKLDNKWMYIKLFKTFNYENIFIGKSKNMKDDISKFMKMYGPKYDGNSILIHVKKNKYIYIGLHIFSFTSIEPIKEFYSNIGILGLSYGIAISDKNTFLLLEKKYIPNDKFPKFTKEIKENAYNYYYGINKKKPSLKKYSNELKGFIMIHKNNLFQF
jgi:hypothetical protein